MIVVCPECGTKFSLDQSRIPGATAKVRCSRCRHVFRITREGQVVAPAFEPPGAATPPVKSPPGNIGEVTPAASGLEPGPAPEDQPDFSKAPPVQPGPAKAEIPDPWARRRLWLWLSLLLPAIALIAVLVWLGWQGLLPGLRPRRQPAPAAGPKAEAPAPSPTVVTPPAPPVPAADLKDLSVDWAQARYQGLVNDKGGGQLLLIQGEVVNNGKSPRGPIRLKATLTDSQHQPLKEEIVYPGTTFTDSELKTLKPEAIKRWLAKPGGRSQERVLKPGNKQPFTVIFFGMSDNLAETQSGFQIMVIDGPAVPE